MWILKKRGEEVNVDINTHCGTNQLGDSVRMETCGSSTQGNLCTFQLHRNQVQKLKIRWRKIQKFCSSWVQMIMVQKCDGA
jgi:hypothetical protein